MTTRLSARSRQRAFSFTLAISPVVAETSVRRRPAAFSSIPKGRPTIACKSNAQPRANSLSVSVTCYGRRHDSLLTWHKLLPCWSEVDECNVSKTL